MNKFDFINWFLNRYNVSDSEFENELNKYNNGLIRSVDFQLLKEHIEKHCKFKPSVNDLNRIVKMNDYIEKVYPRCYALQHAIDIQKTEHIEMKDFPIDLKRRINALCNKLGMPKRFEGI